MSDVGATRLQLWQALSELFLDSEVSEATLDGIARTVRASGYAHAEVERILWAEVYPVLRHNLDSPAGEWAGWSDAWLLAHLRVNGSSRRPRNTAVAREIERCWRCVLDRVEGKK
ncbi:DUF7079 family protein [Pseudomonas sp. UBA6562]|uniref:DUF7079 family protein n=1 Tax=Pseudomonas sp. UBA6562 TaxID=1947332 RepID=UPI0025EFF5AD|nr:hypothetical protein [Pseudomonas sp. UBA6562]